MDKNDLTQTNAELAELMREKLGVRGATLAKTMRRMGRRLPRKIRAAGATLVKAEALWDNPKLRRQIDSGAVRSAEKRLRTYLRDIDPSDRRWGYWIGVLTPLAFNLLLLFGITVAFLVWSGRV